MASSARLAAVWVLFALAPELIVRPGLLWSSGWGGALTFTTSAVASLCVWWLLVTGIAALRASSPLAGAAATVLVAPLGVLLTVGAIHYRWFFGADVRPVAIAYFLQNPRYSLSLIAPSLEVRVVVALLGGAAVAIATLRWLTRTPAPNRGRAARYVAPLALAGLSWVSVPALGRTRDPCLAEVRGLRALALGVGARASSARLRALPVPRREPVPPAVPPRAPDVVLVLHESLPAARVAPWNGARAREGGWMRALEARGGVTEWFADAVSLAPVTAVSVPSTLSGLPPDAPIDDYERAPLVWHDAAARGYTTGLFSAQDLSVDFFQGFYLADGGPTECRHAGGSGAPRVNDRGVDDATTVDQALDFARRAPAARPLLLIVQLNATHWPCWAPRLADGAAIPERCVVATRYVDEQVGRLLDGVMARRAPREAVVVGTSDHGESFGAGHPARAVSYYQDVLRVPLWVHLPAGLVAASPGLAAALSSNRARRVANYDLAPTLLDLWGAWPLTSSRPMLAGRSLLRPVEDRVIVATADTAIWAPLTEGFAALDGSRKWLVDELGGARLYDLSRDPDETHDLAPAAPLEARARLVAALRGHATARATSARLAPWLAP